MSDNDLIQFNYTFLEKHLVKYFFEKQLSNWTFVQKCLVQVSTVMKLLLNF